jgi:hypothetical protein
MAQLRQIHPGLRGYSHIEQEFHWDYPSDPHRYGLPKNRGFLGAG